jgi:hypothetical protein
MASHKPALICEQRFVLHGGPYQIDLKSRYFLDFPVILKFLTANANFHPVFLSVIFAIVPMMALYVKPERYC